MGVYPYITASIIMQLLVPVIPRLQAISKEGESGRNRINLHQFPDRAPGDRPGVRDAAAPERRVAPANYRDFGSGIDPLGTVSILLTMTAGTMLLIWIGELITQYGIGNGISMIIFGGIVASLPSQIGGAIIAGTSFASIVIFVVLAVITVRLDRADLRGAAADPGPGRAADPRLADGRRTDDPHPLKVTRPG
jgi:preprotein translocase subunit SecY